MTESVPSDDTRVSVTWFNDEQRVLVYYFAKNWQWWEYNDAVKIAQGMLNSVDHEVDILMNLTESRFLPPGAIRETHKALANPRTENVRKTVIAGVNPFIASIGEVAEKMSPNINWEYTMVSTLEDAYKALGI